MSCCRGARVTLSFTYTYSATHAEGKGRLSRPRARLDETSFQLSSRSACRPRPHRFRCPQSRRPQSRGRGHLSVTASALRTDRAQKKKGSGPNELVNCCEVACTFLVGSGPLAPSMVAFDLVPSGKDETGCGGATPRRAVVP